MIGKKIKELRDSLGLSQMDFGDKCNISDASICEWENNKKQPSLISITKIINAYKINPAYFFDSSGSVCKQSTKKKLSNRKRAKK